MSVNAKWSDCRADTAWESQVFDIQYDSQGCNTSWNAVPVPLDNLTFT